MQYDLNVCAFSGSDIGRSVIIGANSVVDKGTKINSSVFGNNCKIHEKVSVISSHIGNNVTIGVT